MCERTCFSQAKCSRTCTSRRKCYGRQFSSKKKITTKMRRPRQSAGLLCAAAAADNIYKCFICSCVCVCVCVFCVCSSSSCLQHCVLHAACVLADKICYSVEQHHLLSAPTTLSQNRSGEGETLNEAQRITNPYTSLRFQRSPANICVCLCVYGMCV